MVVKSKEAIDEFMFLSEQLKSQISENQAVLMGKLHILLRSAAALLCKERFKHAIIIHELVNIPFTIFTMESISLGISFWLGVINENPELESAVLTEITKCWEISILTHQGIFSKSLK